MISFFLTLYRFGVAIIRALRDEEFRALFVLVLVILASGTFFYHGVEHFSYLNALYFSVTTLTTVGYGDLTPHTPLGKIFTMIYIFVGIGIILGFIEVLATHARAVPTPNTQTFLERKPKTLWFKAKRYGYGWTPATWQGWACIALYTLALGFVALGVNWAAPTQSDIFLWFVPLTLLFTTILVVVSYKTGETPRWRWGDDDK